MCVCLSGEIRKVFLQIWSPTTAQRKIRQHRKSICLPPHSLRRREREEKELFKRRAEQPFSRFHITLIDWRRRERKKNNHYALCMTNLEAKMHLVNTHVIFLSLGERRSRFIY
jgi:hypothetical protein